MNILPLVLALVLILSVLTIEKLEKFKNQMIVQKEYHTFLEKGERQVFNQRQKDLFGSNQKDLHQVSFRFLLNQKAREKDPQAAKQYRLLAMELMKVLYGEAFFFRNMERERPQFLEEILNAIEKAADEVPKGMISGVQALAHLDLGDPQLQRVLYHMLKGTMTREGLKGMKEMSPEMKEKAYVSLFNFINYNGKDSVPKIIVQRSPREVLKAVFVSDDVVNAILARRNELAASGDSGAKVAFENEFKDKRRHDIDDKLLDFSISSSDKSEYD